MGNVMRIKHDQSGILQYNKYSSFAGVNAWGRQQDNHHPPHVNHCHTKGSCGNHLGLSESTSFTTLASLLKRCGRTKALLDGRHVHAHIKTYGHDRNTFLGNCLIDMYGNCGSVDDAFEVFENLPNPNVFTWNIMIKTYGQNGELDVASTLFGKMPQKDAVSWNAMMAAYVQFGHGMAALCLFRRMLLECSFPDKITYLCTLDACANMASFHQGLIIHACIVTMGYDQNVAVGTALVHMYGKCGNLQFAMKVFKKLLIADVVAWSTIISVFVNNRQSKEALGLFYELHLEGLKPNTACLVSALDACASLVAIEAGREIHASIVESNHECDVTIGNTLVSMYGKCGSLQEAMNVFHHVACKDVVTWNAVIATHTQNECGNEALGIFQQMQSERVTPDNVTLVCTLDACATLSSLIEGRDIHATIMYTGCERDVMVGTALVNMYGKCGQLQDAKVVFSYLQHRDTISWNAIVAAFAQNRQYQEALDVFHQMQQEGVKPDNISFICVLEACSNLKKGQEIFMAVTETGYEQHVDVSNALICMYGRCGSLCDARLAFSTIPFPSIASWNAIIGVFAQNGNSREALQLFQSMKCNGFEPDKITFVYALDACASLQALEEGQEIHVDIINMGYEGDAVVGTALIGMYGKCMSPCGARCVFGSVLQPDIVTWNAMFAVLAQNDSNTQALHLLYGMQNKGVEPNGVSFVCVLDACASLPAFEQGLEIHSFIIEIRYEDDTVVGTALVNMYGKCGSLLEARSAFERVRSRDVISCNAMIAAYAQNGEASQALKTFNGMHLECVQPDEITFVCLLTACSHAGLVDAGRYYFALMEREHGMSWTQDHYGCMVDLLGRAGILGEAEALINKMPSESGSIAWPCLLNACRLHDDADRGTRAAKHCFEQDLSTMAPLVTLSNILAAAAGRGVNVVKV